MSIQRRITPLIFTMLLAAIVSVMAARHSQESAGSQQREQIQSVADEPHNQFPIVDYDAPETSNAESRAERQLKSGKYDNAHLPLDPSVSTDSQILSTLDWEDGLSALPVIESHAIVKGRVSEAKAYLSNDKSAVYSEFTVHIDEVLKDDKPVALSPGSYIPVERDGGRVRFPSGSITLSMTRGQGMPLTGQSYILFLTHDFPLHKSSEKAFHLLTGYELRDGLVFPLDNPGNGTHPLAATYRGAEVKALLTDLRLAIRKTSEKRISK